MTWTRLDLFVANWPLMLLLRVLHRYGNTRSVSKMGNTGTGTVVDFGTPQHTAYLYCGVMGIHGLIT